MTDLQQRLRDAISASVGDAEPSFDLMTAVRRRHRQRLRRLAVAGPAVMVVIAAAVFLAARHAQPAHHLPGAGTTRPGKQNLAAPAFPGGGRLLLDDGGVLSWLYPHGRTVRIPGLFDGAHVSARHLVAWRYTDSGAVYYTMNLNGSRQRLVLPTERDKKLSVINAVLSPDGSTLAYIRQDIASPVVVTFTLWVLDLSTGHRANLGTISPSAFSWMDGTTILTATPNGKSLQLVSAVTGHRTTYLTVTDPGLVHAYERARPGAGPPASIGSDGLNGSGASARIAVWLAASRRTTTFQPAEVIMAGRTPLVTYAPLTPEILSLTWGPDGLVLLQTGHGDGPGTWKTYAATLQSPRPSTPFPFGMDGATFNPAGNVMALEDNGTVTFVPTPRPACERTAKCLNFQPPYPVQNGTVQAWIP